MNTKHLNLRALLFYAAAFASLTSAPAQGFNVGSDGTLGDVVIDASTTIDLPADGKLHYKSLTVNSDVRVTFKRNARNTPVFILSQGDVIINGTLDVNGSIAAANTGGQAGPGGFDGGRPGFGDVGPGFGYGPGGGVAGDAGCNGNTSAGGGSYGTGGTHGGSTYGSSLLIPIVGGSGGGGGSGQPGSGGGGGGGAILIAANTRIAMNGRIEARGGSPRTCFNAGSGGAIRLVAFKVEGAGSLDVSSTGSGGFGRIRVDTVERSNLNFSFNSKDVTSVGSNLLTFPPTIPALATIEAAGNAVPQGGGPVTFTLPFGSSADRTVKVQARDFGRVVPIRVTLTPDSGTPTTVDAEIDNTTANPATVELPITVPINTLVTIHAWTR